MEKDMALTAPCPAAQNVSPLRGRMREFQLGAGIGVSTVKSLVHVHRAQGSMRRDWSPPAPSTLVWNLYGGTVAQICG